MSRSAAQYNDGLTEAMEMQIAYLDAHPEAEFSDRGLGQLWDVVYGITKRARPVASWTPGAWTRWQAVNR